MQPAFKAGVKEEGRLRAPATYLSVITWQ